MNSPRRNKKSDKQKKSLDESIVDEQTGNINDSSNTNEPIIAIGRQKISWQRVILLISASLSIIIIILIFSYILINGASVVTEIGLFKFLFGGVWNPRAELYGILHGIIGTLMVVLIAMIIAIPISVSCAIFMAEIAPPPVRKIIKPTVELLASIPSIVYGFFGLFTFVPAIKYIFNLQTGETALSGGLILAIMVMPTIVSISDDAIQSVPHAFKEGSFALGATRWQTIWNVIIPAALSGIFAAIILAFGRAIGETMAVLLIAGGASQIPKPFYNILVPVDPLTAIIARELGEAAEGSVQFHAIFGIAIILFIITFIVNLTGDLLVKRYSKKLRGA